MPTDHCVLGACYEGEGWTRFRVWAPDRASVDLLLDEGPRSGSGSGALRTEPMTRGAEGEFTLRTRASPGMRYRYRLDRVDAWSDPCSRFQPEGPHGPSQIVDPRAYRWSEADARFQGAPSKGAVIYELHVGAFTPEGTWAAAETKLPLLRELGVTAVELMPVNTFPGRFNWGYDGTHLFAPNATYGTPDALRHFVDAAHGHGIAVLLDVVYNHLGPDGNYLWQYAKAYFSKRYGGEWGEPLNFDAEGSAQVRRFVVENARHWIAEYHLDGLRIDATQCLFDRSPRHILAELTEAARAAAPRKQLLIVAENEPQDRTLVTPVTEGGHGCDALWVDDFHHCARVALTGRAEAYLRDYRGSARELLANARHNALYQGQHYLWQDKPRGTPLFALAAERCVFFLQNHDQIANSLGARRLHTHGLPRARALTVFWLTLPQTPMLFMGQEFFASAPFSFFVDHKPELQSLVQKGRSAFMRQAASARHAQEQEGYVEEIGEPAFRRAKLDWDEATLGDHKGALELHRALLRLRREDPVFTRQDRAGLEGATLGEQALVLRFFGRSDDEGDRLVVLNLGAELRLEPCPEPLLAPPPGRIWEPVLSSEETRFGGAGALFPEAGGPWIIPGQCAWIVRSGGMAPPRRTMLDEALARAKGPKR